MINFNGALLEKETSIFTRDNRGFKYGDAIFETIKVKDGGIVFLEDHYFRLMASMRMLRMEIPMSFTMQFMEDEILKTIAINELEDNARVRFSVFRKDGGLYTPLTNQVSFVIEASVLNVIFRPVYQVDIYKDFYVQASLLSTIKTSNRLLNTLASIYSKENDLDNCILVNDNKNVVEAINGNLFMVKGTVITTPPLTDGCIKGIIRKKMIELIQGNKEYTLVEGKISPFDLQKADELFITNTIVGVQPITKFRKTTYSFNTAKILAVQLDGLR
ncbi:MAG: aminotransferase class IV [Flavobacteriaceae bacterium]|nr:MAG: aminotransferase class IV [Flavobacteriaceae bacterium]